MICLPFLLSPVSYPQETSYSLLSMMVINDNKKLNIQVFLYMPKHLTFK